MQARMKGVNMDSNLLFSIITVVLIVYIFAISGQHGNGGMRP